MTISFYESSSQDFITCDNLNFVRIDRWESKGKAGSLPKHDFMGGVTLSQTPIYSPVQIIENKAAGKDILPVAHSCIHERGEFSVECCMCSTKQLTQIATVRTSLFAMGIPTTVEPRN